MNDNVVVIARFTWLHVLLTLVAGVVLVFLLYYFLARPPQSMSVVYARALAILSAAATAYYFWRSARIFKSLVFEDSVAIFMREGWLQGAGRRRIKVAEIESFELRVNEAGRAVLTVLLSSNARVRVPVTGMEPAPDEIAQRLSDLTFKPLVNQVRKA